MEERDDSQKEGWSFLTYVMIGGCAIAALLFFKNIVSSGPRNQDISKMVPADMKVHMQSLVKSTSTEKIAVISVTGVIGMPGLTEKITAELRSASQNAEVRAVILKVNSPGGGVYDTDLIYREILKFKESKKPLVAFFNGVAASGGYYISAPADRIMATHTTITGSIGVIAQFPNYSELMNKLGLKMHTIKSGSQKDMLSPFRPMDQEGEKIAQAWIDESYDEFVRVVSNGRKMKEETVRKLADGRIYTAKQAAKNHLIDNVGYFEDAVELAKKLANSPNASVVEMNAVDSRFGAFMELLHMKFQSDKTVLEKLAPLSGVYYMTPGIYEKYLK